MGDDGEGARATAVAKELSLVRVVRGEVVPDGWERLTLFHDSALPEDEEIRLLETEDGGRAIVFGAGPGRDDREEWEIGISVERLSRELAPGSSKPQGAAVLSLRPGRVMSPVGIRGTRRLRSGLTEPIGPGFGAFRAAS